MAAVLAYLIYGVRIVIRAIGNTRRRLRSAPDYVVFTLEGPYRQLPPPRAALWQRVVSQPAPNFQDLQDQFRTVARDSRVKGVVLHLRSLGLSPSLGLAHLQTLRNLIEELRQAGKRVVTWSTTYDTARYYVAGGAHELLLQPGGLVGPLGVAQRYIFLKNALTQVGLEGDFIQVSPYKAAMDTLTRHDMSAEHREMSNWLIESAHGQLVHGIAAGRQISESDARAVVDGAPYTDVKALEGHVVDGVIGEEDLPTHLGSRERPVRLLPWEVARQRLLRLPLSPPGRHVALIRIEGDIADGRSQRLPFRPPVPVPFVMNERAGDLTVVQAARAAMASRRVAAVLVWVESPGGSASASEAIAAVLEKLAARKPVVVAMGSVAASGGYYVSLPAHWVVAQPGTLTGSIGVVSGKVVNARLIQRLGVNRETISRGLHVLLDDNARPYSGQERQIASQAIMRTYELFRERVAAARKLDSERVEAVAGGRVWTGQQALERGLVDELGGLEAALRKARKLAGLRELSPVREISQRQPRFAPIPSPVAALDYALAGIKVLDGLTPLCVWPLAGA